LKGSTGEGVEKQQQWDVFISHATEDKKSVAKPLADALASFGLRVWYDEFTLKPGDSLSRSIDRGLALTKYGVVILSPAFFAKSWPEYELRGLIARELGTTKVIIPVWHNVERDEVLRFSPPLADKLAIKAVGRSPGELAIDIIEVISPELFDKIHLRRKFLEATARAKTIKIKPSQIVSGPLRHKELPDDLISRIRLIRAALLGFHTHSMKCWLDGFQHDTYPSLEIAVWERICSTVHEYLTMTSEASAEVEQVFNVALSLANGANKAQLSEYLKPLPPNAFKVIQRLMTHKVPVYDVIECCPFSKRADEYEEVRPTEDREHFPVDLPNQLIGSGTKATNKLPKKRR
jgi:TIR domain